MARTRTHKLLLCAEDEKSQFFDLVTDPFELNNRIGDADCAKEVHNLREALLRWSLFTTQGQAHLDMDAPRISGENIPEDSASTARKMADYFRERMLSAGVTAS